MSLVRKLARPLIAAPFIYEGIRTARTPERATSVSPAAFAKADEYLHTTSLPSSVDSATIVRAAGALAAGAGVAYAAGKAPRLAAAVLLSTTTVGWAGRKKIWELSGEERAQEIQALLSDAGLLGGILLAVVDTDGRPSAAYRWNKFVDRAHKNAAVNKKKAQLTSKSLRKSADKFSTSAAKSFDSFSKSAAKSGDAFSKSASKSLDAASKSVTKASKKLAKQLG